MVGESFRYSVLCVFKEGRINRWNIMATKNKSARMLYSISILGMIKDAKGNVCPVSQCTAMHVLHPLSFLKENSCQE